MKKAGRLTHDHNPTYTLALLGNDTNKNWHKTHFHSVFIARTHTQTRTHTYPGKSDKTGIIEYEMNTQAAND